MIAIIAILAAILFPVFARARENARRASCQSNLKQIGLGIFQYTQDYDERLPMSRHGAGLLTPWQVVVQPYVKSTQLFKCPSNSSTSWVNDTGSTIPRSYKANGTGNDASFNSQWGGVQPMNILNTISANGGVALSRIQSTAQVILVGESGPGSNGDAPNGDPEYYRVDNTGCFGFQNHLSMTNFLFVDGHVKAMKLTATGTPINMWNVDNTTNPGDANPGPAGTVLANGLATLQARMN